MGARGVFVMFGDVEKGRRGGSIIELGMGEVGDMGGA